MWPSMFEWSYRSRYGPILRWFTFFPFYICSRLWYNNSRWCSRFLGCKRSSISPKRSNSDKFKNSVPKIYEGRASSTCSLANMQNNRKKNWVEQSCFIIGFVDFINKHMTTATITYTLHAQKILIMNFYTKSWTCLRFHLLRKILLFINQQICILKQLLLHLPCYFGRYRWLKFRDDIKWKLLPELQRDLERFGDVWMWCRSRTNLQWEHRLV